MGLAVLGLLGAIFRWRQAAGQGAAKGSGRETDSPREGDGFDLTVPRGDSLWFRAPRRPPGLTGRALSTAQWPAIPLRLGSGGFVEGGAGVERCCAAQIAGMSIVVWATAMHRAAVGPNHEIAGPPFMAVDEFGPGCVEREVVQ